MICTKCESDNLQVLDTRANKIGVKRRRECLTCGHRITTYEAPINDNPYLNLEGKDLRLIRIRAGLQKLIDETFDERQE